MRTTPTYRQVVHLVDEQDPAGGRFDLKIKHQGPLRRALQTSNTPFQQSRAGFALRILLSTPMREP